MNNMPQPLITFDQHGSNQLLYFILLVIHVFEQMLNGICPFIVLLKFSDGIPGRFNIERVSIFSYSGHRAKPGKHRHLSCQARTK